MQMFSKLKKHTCHISLFFLSIFHTLISFLIFLFDHTMQHVGSPQEMKPSFPAVEAGSLNHWTAREVPLYFLLYAEIILEQILCEISRAINT